MFIYSLLIVQGGRGSAVLPVSEEIRDVLTRIIFSKVTLCDQMTPTV